MDYDFIVFIVLLIVFVVIPLSVINGINFPVATYDGLDYKGDSGLVVAGSGEDLANASSTEVDNPTADRWIITSGTTETTEETTAAGPVIKIILKDVSTTAPLWVWVLCAACFVLIGGLAVGIWILVRKEFGHG